MTRISEECSAAAGGENLFTQPRSEEYSAAAGGKRLFTQPHILWIAA
jgi:hypothetical protein